MTPVSVNQEPWALTNYQTREERKAELAQFLPTLPSSQRGWRVEGFYFFQAGVPTPHVYPWDADGNRLGEKS